MGGAPPHEGQDGSTNPQTSGGVRASRQDGGDRKDGARPGDIFSVPERRASLGPWLWVSAAIALLLVLIVAVVVSQIGTGGAG